VAVSANCYTLALLLSFIYTVSFSEITHTVEDRIAATPAINWFIFGTTAYPLNRRTT